MRAVRAVHAPALAVLAHDCAHRPRRGPVSSHCRQPKHDLRVLHNAGLARFAASKRWEPQVLLGQLGALEKQLEAM